MMASSMPPEATAFNEDKALMTGLASTAGGPVDQLEDRYLGMVEAVGSNPTRSTFLWGEDWAGPENFLKQNPAKPAFLVQERYPGWCGVPAIGYLPAKKRRSAYWMLYL